MSSQARMTREEERRLNLRTLVIASAASATAAIVTSQFWTAGTPIAAAVTPVIVALISELLHRPTERIVQRLTVETDALPDAEREAARGPGPPTRRTPEVPARPRTIYGQPKRKIALRGIAVTAALAFVVGMVALTVPELITGESIGKGRGPTTYFGQDRDKKDQPEQQEQPPAVTQPPEQEPRPTTTTPTTPEKPPETQTTPTTPTVPTETTPAP